MSRPARGRTPQAASGTSRGRPEGRRRRGRARDRAVPAVDGPDPELVAPCGMNCGLCSAHLAMRNDVKAKGIRMPYCKGCRPRDKRCAFLKKRCDLLLEGKVEYCYECAQFPCESLKQLDERYRELYRMSMVENLRAIKLEGVEAFLEEQGARWRCPECGGTICCHNGICFSCGLERLRERARERGRLYRWDHDGEGSDVPH